MPTPEEKKTRISRPAACRKLEVQEESTGGKVPLSKETPRAVPYKRKKKTTLKEGEKRRGRSNMGIGLEPAEAKN